MSTTRRALLGFLAGLPFALRSMASEPERSLSWNDSFNEKINAMRRERLLSGQWSGERYLWMHEYEDGLYDK